MALGVQLVEAVAVVLLLGTFVFLALRVLPGDPAFLVLGDQASGDAVNAFRHRYHFDEPLLQQYLRFLKGMAHLDWGESIRRPGERAADRVWEAMPPTASLAFVAVALGAMVGVALGTATVAPWFPKGKPWLVRGIDAMAALPFLAFAPVVSYVLCVRCRWVPLPGDPDAGLAGLLFAAGLLAVPLAAHVARVTGAALASLQRSQFLQVAIAKGARPWRVWFLHGLPPALGTILTVVASQLGALLGGAVVLEKLFERPGLGSLMVEAYNCRDVPVLEASVIASGALFVVTQLSASAVHYAFDPRVRR
jgi:ABC-type dipeptide/oligopeptide/nickel transport system permease component